MSKTTHSLAAGFLAVALSGLVHADHVTLSGVFEGDEPTLPQFPRSCTLGEGDPLGYVQAGPVRVSQTAIYDVVDAGNPGFQEFVPGAVDVVARIYAGDFNSSDLDANFVFSVDTGEQIELEAGVDYVLVMQHWCENTAGVWAIAISGPGDVTGPGVVNSPDRTIGEFTAEDPTADFGSPDGLQVYDVNGPVRFDQEGTYFYSDLSIHRRVDMELFVYEDDFDPQDTGVGLIAQIDDAGAIDIREGVDYYFVSTSLFGTELGEWHYALFPPGRVEINRFLSGLWVDEREDPVAGDYAQGLFIEVFPSFEFVFGAWFTWDLADGAPSVDAVKGRTPEALGATDQRWITAFGNYETGDTRMDISFENTTGGVFNASSPNIDRDSAYGTGSIIANGCRELVVEFDLPDAPTQGSTTLTRVDDEFVLELCNLTGARAGVIE